jgi:RTX calcium-binding nonapeptide repeat (4 copies)
MILRLGILAAVLALISGIAVALTQTNTVPATQAGQTSQATAADELKPAICSSITLTGPVRTTGTNGNDLILGTNAGETLSGGQGNDCMVGGAGNDIIRGQGGSDVLIGGPGTDTCTAGAGATVVYDPSCETQN